MGKKISRRRAIAQMSWASGGLVLLSSCAMDQEKVDKALKAFQVSEADKDLMTAVLDCMLPQTDSKAASALALGDFVWMMAEDCLDETGKSKFLTSFTHFKQAKSPESKQSFLNCSAEEQATWISSVLNAESEEKASEDKASVDKAKNYVELSKQFAIMGYVNSEYFLTEIQPYALVPGKAPSCEPSI